MHCCTSILSFVGQVSPFFSVVDSDEALKTRTLNLQLSELTSTALHLSGDVTQAPWWLENRQVGSDVFFVKPAQLPL